MKCSGSDSQGMVSWIHGNTNENKKYKLIIINVLSIKILPYLEANKNAKILMSFYNWNKNIEHTCKVDIVKSI